MQLGVLGPVALVSNGASVALGGPKQRLVLGLLIAHRGRVVAVDELIDGLWPEGPQAQPRKTVQVYVTRLRRAFGDAAHALVSEAAGYRLDPDIAPVDADAFETLLDAALAETDDDTAVTALRNALGLWRGEAFVDVRDCAAILPAAVHLDTLRLNATFELFTRELRLRPHSVLAEIEQTVGTHPLHEGFAAQLMTVLYRVGRQADALAAYQALRQRLADELGVEPGPAVRELHGRIVRHELDAAPVARIAAPARQRRRVTIVAVRFGIDAPAGDEPDAEEEFSLLSPLRRAATARIAGHGGVVVTEAGDSLTASFGYPSRGDSPVQAVAAALSIRDLAADADKRIRTYLGVEAGEAVLEASADSAAVLSSITGAPLRAAASLRDRAADGRVLLAPRIAELVAGEFEIEQDVHDATTFAAIARATGRRERPVTDLLGRDGAVAAVVDVLGGPSGGVRAVAVTGPPGIGKTAVVDTAIAQLGSGWGAVRLSGERVHDQGPLTAFRRALPESFDGGADPPVRRIVAALDARWQHRRRLLVVEDADALDPASFEVLDALADHVVDVGLVLTTRATTAISLGGDVVPAVALQPLDRATARRLARDAGGDRRLGIAVCDEIAERSGGNPWHVLELAEATLHNRDAGVPTSLYDSLTWRLDRLGPARELAQRCSVLGTSFAVSDIYLVAADLPAATVDQHLAAMVADDVVTVDDDVGRFTHTLVAQIAYESVLHSARTQLHAAVADALAARADVDQATLAYHLEASGRHRDAAFAWRRAASAGIRSARNRDARRYSRRALALIDAHLDDGDAEVAHLRERVLLICAHALGATHHGSAELADILDQLRVRHVGGPGTNVVVDLLDVGNRQALGDFAGAAAVARSSTAAFAESPDRMSAAFADQFLGATLVWQGHLDDGVAELSRAAEYWGEPSGDVEPLSARPLGALWTLLGLAGWFRGSPDAVVDADLARAAAIVPAGDGDGRCLVAGTSAVVEQLRGDADVVRAAIDPIWSLAIDLGSEFWFGWAQALLGWAIAATDGAAGRAMIEEVLDGSPTRQMLPYFGYLLGARLGVAGEFDAAVERLTAAERLAGETGEALWLPLLGLERGRWLIASGDTAAGLAAADEARRRAEAIGAAQLVPRCDDVARLARQR